MITPGDRERLLRALVGVPAGKLPPRIHKELEEQCANDLAAIEPIFEEILTREMLRFAKFVIGDVLTEEGLRGIHKRFLETKQEQVPV